MTSAKETNIDRCQPHPRTASIVRIRDEEWLVEASSEDRGMVWLSVRGLGLFVRSVQEAMFTSRSVPWSGLPHHSSHLARDRKKPCAVCGSQQVSPVSAALHT